MRAPSRQWLARSATLLVLVGLAGCAETTALVPGSTAVDRAAPEDDLWAMVPAEADLVLFADLAKLRDSPWTKDSFDKVAPANGAAADPAIDQVRAMDRILFAKIPTLRDGASVLIAQGEVGRETMRTGFEASGGQAERSSYRGAELLVRGDEALAFLGRRTVVSGFVLAVRAALDCGAGLARGIESESWLRQLRGDLEPRASARDLVVSLYAHAQPATREALLREMGEGGEIEYFGGRVDLGADLDAAAVAVVGSDIQARDLAGRLAERIRDVRRRPVVAVFGLGSVLDSLALAAKGNRVHAKIHVSEKERGEISQRMTLVTEILTKMRAQQEKDGKGNQENPQP